MIAHISHSNNLVVKGRHYYFGMEDATTVPTVIITADKNPRNTIQQIPKDLIPLGEVIQRRPTNRAERRAMRRGKNGK